MWAIILLTVGSLLLAASMLLGLFDPNAVLIGLVGGVAVAGATYADAALQLPPEVPDIARPAIAFLAISTGVVAWIFKTGYRLKR